MPKLIIEGTPEEIADTVFMLGIAPDGIEVENEVTIDCDEGDCNCGHNGCKRDGCERIKDVWEMYGAPIKR